MIRLVLVTVVLVLAGCAGGNVEMQSDPSGSDAMRTSPCACEMIDTKRNGYVWRG
jgi:hypothetical protein